LVDAERTADAICGAIAAGRVTVEATPLSWPTVGRVLTDLFASSLLPGPSPGAWSPEPG